MTLYKENVILFVSFRWVLIFLRCFVIEQRKNSNQLTL